MLCSDNLIYSVYGVSASDAFLFLSGFFFCLSDGLTEQGLVMLIAFSRKILSIHSFYFYSDC